MNYMSVLPKEMKFEILLYLNYRYLKSFCCTSYDNYAMLDRLIKLKQKQTKGYPRLDGKAKLHGMDSIISTGRDLKECLERANKLIDNQSMDLVKGDIVEFSKTDWWYPHQVIYNGEVLEELDYDTHGEERLLKHHTVIENDVPMTYYCNIFYNDDYIYFNYTLVKEECLRNVTFNETKQKWMTTFTYHHITYNVLGYCSRRKMTLDDVKLVFIHNLNKDEPDFYIDELIDNGKNTMILDCEEYHEVDIELLSEGLQKYQDELAERLALKIGL